VPWRADEPGELAGIIRAREQVGSPGAVLVANPLPADQQLDPALHDRVLDEGLEAARREGVTGKAMTPFLLERFHRETAGESLRANVALVLRNAELAADIAVALA
jgi:pseudouridine-5'-phosphate glycosidase